MTPPPATGMDKRQLQAMGIAPRDAAQVVRIAVTQAKWYDLYLASITMRRSPIDPVEPCSIKRLQAVMRKYPNLACRIEGGELTITRGDSQ